MYVSLGAASAETIAMARVTAPECWGAESESCKNNVPNTPACRAQTKLYEEDEAAYRQFVDSIPMCSEKPPMLPMIAAGAGGLLAGFVLGYLTR